MPSTRLPVIKREPRKKYAQPVSTGPLLHLLRKFEELEVPKPQLKTATTFCRVECLAPSTAQGFSDLHEGGVLRRPPPPSPPGSNEGNHKRAKCFTLQVATRNER